jgi:hypothetical protein
MNDYVEPALETLRKRAEAINCYIENEEWATEGHENPPEIHGRYTLMTARELGGYWAHVGAVNLTVLEEQIAEIEQEWESRTVQEIEDEARQNLELMRQLKEWDDEEARTGPAPCAPGRITCVTIPDVRPSPARRGTEFFCARARAANLRSGLAGS